MQYSQLYQIRDYMFFILILFIIFFYFFIFCQAIDFYKNYALEVKPTAWEG